MIEKVSAEEVAFRRSVLRADACEYCDGMGADVDAEPIQTGAHSVSWVGSMSKCRECNGTGLRVARGEVECGICKARYPFGSKHSACKATAPAS